MSRQVVGESPMGHRVIPLVIDQSERLETELFAEPVAFGLGQMSSDNSLLHCDS